MPPTGALVTVRYGGYYFSIMQNDLTSKNTFSLMKLLFQIQAGDIGSDAPILTIPVGCPGSM